MELLLAPPILVSSGIETGLSFVRADSKLVSLSLLGAAKLCPLPAPCTGWMLAADVMREKAWFALEVNEEKGLTVSIEVIGRGVGFEEVLDLTMTSSSCPSFMR